MKIKAYSPGKIIFFGEHGVVYGTPALAATIDRGVEVTLEKCKKKQKYGKVESLIIKKFEDEHNLSLPYFKITINSELIKGCGRGSAVAAALTKALHKFSNKELTKQVLFEYVNFADQTVHGKNASGLRQ